MSLTLEQKKELNELINNETDLTLEEINKLVKEKYDQFKGLIGEGIAYNLVLKDFGIEFPEFVKEKIQKELANPNKPEPLVIAETIETDNYKNEATEAPFVATNNNKLDLKQQFRLLHKNINEIASLLKIISEDIGVWKNYQSRMISLLENLLSKNTATSSVITQPTSPPPIEDISDNSTEQTGPALRLNLDGGSEMGTAPSNKKYTFVNIIATPIEFTEKAVKITFQWISDQDNTQKSSWDSKNNSNEIWLSKALISPNSVIKRLQVPQTIQVANWWARQNSK